MRSSAAAVSAASPLRSTRTTDEPACRQGRDDGAADARGPAGHDHPRARRGAVAHRWISWWWRVLSSTRSQSISTPRPGPFGTWTLPWSSRSSGVVSGEAQLVRGVQLEELGVPGGAGDVQVRDVHRAHAGVELAVQSERLGQVQDLERPGDAPLPGHVGADDVAGVRPDELGHPGRPAVGGLGGGDGDVERRREVRVLVDVLVVERLLEPVEVEPLERPPDLDGLGQGVVDAGRVEHQGHVRERVAERLGDRRCGCRQSPPGWAL